MPLSYKARKNVYQRTQVRSAAQRAASSLLRQAGYNSRRTASMARSMVPSSRFNRRGAANKETGYIDFAAAGFNCSTTGTISLIATIAQGASVNQRVGKKVTLKSIQMRGNVIAGTTTTISDCAILIVYDRRPTGSVPPITDILDTANATSFNNDTNSGRFKILRRYDFVITGNSTTPATGGEAVDCSDFIKMMDLPAVFKAAGTGAIGDIEEGALYAVSVGSNVAGTTAPVATLGFRTRFVDN